MPLSFSNIQPTPNTSGSAPKSPYSSLKSPKNAISPISLGQALKNKTNNSAMKTAVAAPVVTPVTTQRTAQPTLGLTQDQAMKNLQNAGYSTTQDALSGTVTSQPQVQVPVQRTPSATAATPNLVGQTFPTEGEPKKEKESVYGGLISKGINSLTEAGEVQKEEGLIRQAMKRTTRDVMGNPYYSGNVRVGLASNIAQQEGARLEGLATERQSLTQQGQAYLQGASLAAPQQVPFGTQYIDPTTGKAIDIQGGGGNQNPGVQAQTYAQEVASGRRSYADAVAAMGLYGNAGKQFLDQAIRTVNPGFNFAQAQSLGANQGAVGPAYSFAQQALSTVEAAVANLGSVQRTNLPLVNAAANIGSIYSGIGSEQTRAMIGAVQTLRNAYASLLASAKGGTPTDYSAQAQAEIPDQPTPNDLAAIKHNFETLGGARVQIYGAPGTGTQGGGAPAAIGGGLYDF